MAAITDLHALRIDDAALLSAMQREVALKAQLEKVGAKLRAQMPWLNEGK